MGMDHASGNWTADMVRALPNALVWLPDAAHPPLSIDLPGYFAEVLGDSPA